MYIVYRSVPLSKSVRKLLAVFLQLTTILLWIVLLSINHATVAANNIPFIRQEAFNFGKNLYSLRGGSLSDGDSGDANNSTTSVHHPDNSNFTLLSETLIYENWRRLISRRVQLPSGLVANFEIVGQKRSLVLSSEQLDDHPMDHHLVHDQAVLIFVWHRKTQTTSLIREYMPSVHRKMFGVAAGMVEGDKHQPSLWKHPVTGFHDTNMSIQEVAARCELEEECRLRDGEWFRLTPEPVVMDKYSMTGLTVFLVIDPISVGMEDGTNGTELQRDKSEEGMDIVSAVTLHQLFQLIGNSELTAIGSWACLLAIHHLRILGEI